MTGERQRRVRTARILGLLLVVLPACGPPPTQPRPVQRYQPARAYVERPAPEPEVSVELQADEFTERRRVVFRTEMEWETERLPSAMMSIATEGERLSIVVSSSFPDWRWLRCHHTVALLDGAPLELGEVEHRGSVGTGRSAYVIEHVGTTADASVLEGLLNATSLRVRVCTDALRVPESSLDELRQIPILAAEMRAADAVASEDEGVE